MRADQKFLAIGKIGLVQKYTPNPRVLGEVQSSYKGTTLTQNNPRDKRDQSQKQPRRTARETARYNSPVDPTYMSLSTSVEPKSQSRQQCKTITG